MSPTNGKDREVSAGGIATSSAEHFDEHTASVPDEIGVPEILPPAGQGESDRDAATGWPLWDVEQIAALPFFILARRYGELWELDKAETAAVARAWKPILDRYLPLEETALGTALLVTLAVVGPRVMMTDWEKAKRSQTEKRKPATSTKTVESSGSPSSPGSAAPASPPEWEPFSGSAGA